MMRGFSLLACGAALALPAAVSAQAEGIAPAAGTAQAAITAPASHPLATAALEGCVTTGPQVERSATFLGEMTAMTGTTRMLMRIEIQERGPSDPAFRPISFPGLGVWLKASPGVHTFKNLQRVTDLSGPADYRASIHFRWMGAHGRQLRTQVLHTARCAQPASPVTSQGTGSTAATTAAASS
jgi:hypothetical protein